jgi:tRNA(fMet)-specific endonuclease VapC
MFLLDANTISQWIKSPNAKLMGHLKRVPLAELAVSPIVEAELRYGLAKKGITKSRLGVLVDTFLSAVQILSWESSTARCFAQLRTDSEAKGITVDTVDLMIASHAKEDANLTLVTNDGALLRLAPWIKVVDWTK